MAVTTAKLGIGTLFQRANNGGWDTIAGINNITGPSLAQETIDATHMLSADNYREFIAGLRDGGEVSIDGDYAPQEATQAKLLTDLQAGTTDNYRIVLPTAMGLTWTFAAIVIAYEPTGPSDGKYTFTVSLKISGKPTLA